MVRDCAGEGRACGWISNAEGNGCLGGTSGALRSSCADFGYSGACVNGVLVWVEGGQCKTYNCAARGMGCGDDGVNGNNCISW